MSGAVGLTQQSCHPERSRSSGGERDLPLHRPRAQARTTDTNRGKLKPTPITADSVLMKPTRLFALVSILIVPILVAPLATQRTEAAESKIIALEKAWNQAYKFRDKKALTEILHDSVILIDDDGSLQSRAAFLAGVDAALPTDQQQAEPESMSVLVFGDVAIATGVFRRTTMKNGRSFLERERFVDTWIRRGDSWVCIAASATPVLR